MHTEASRFYFNCLWLIAATVLVVVGIIWLVTALDPLASGLIVGGILMALIGPP